MVENWNLRLRREGSLLHSRRQTIQPILLPVDPMMGVEWGLWSLFLDSWLWLYQWFNRGSLVHDSEACSHPSGSIPRCVVTTQTRPSAVTSTKTANDVRGVFKPSGWYRSSFSSSQLELPSGSMSDLETEWKWSAPPALKLDICWVWRSQRDRRPPHVFPECSSQPLNISTLCLGFGL